MILAKTRRNNPPGPGISAPDGVQSVGKWVKSEISRGFFIREILKSVEIVKENQDL